MMFVPQQGNLRFVTEFGRIDAEPGEIVGDSAGVKFRVEILGGPAPGYALRNYGGALYVCGARPDRRQLPLRMRAIFSRRSRPYEDKDTDRTVREWGGALWMTTLPHSPIDRGAWTATTRRTNTTCAASRRSAQSGSTIRSVDFHGADFAVDRRTANIDFGFPGALGGGGKHLPAAVVSHEHHVGIHGPDLRRL